jgi:hypothetical protein
MAAALAPELDVHAHPQDFPLDAAAGMGLFQFHKIVKMQVHLVLLSTISFFCIY